MNDITIRPPKITMALTAIVSLLFVSLGISLLIQSEKGKAFFAVWTALAAGIGAVNLSTSVRTHGDELRVRNLLRTTVIHRAEIERFVIASPTVRGPQGLARIAGSRVDVTLAHGRSAPLSATRRGPFGVRDVEEFQRTLEDWRTAPSLFSRT